MLLICDDKPVKVMTIAKCIFERIGHSQVVAMRPYL